MEGRYKDVTHQGYEAFKTFVDLMRVEDIFPARMEVGCELRPRGMTVQAVHIVSSFKQDPNYKQLIALCVSSMPSF